MTQSYDRTKVREGSSVGSDGRWSSVGGVVAHLDGAEDAEWCGKRSGVRFRPRKSLADCRLVDCGLRPQVEVGILNSQGWILSFTRKPSPHQSRSATLSGLRCLGSAVSMDYSFPSKDLPLRSMSGPHMATGVALPIPVSGRGLGVFCRQGPSSWVLSSRRNESPFFE